MSADTFANKLVAWHYLELCGRRKLGPPRNAGAVERMCVDAAMVLGIGFVLCRRCFVQVCRYQERQTASSCYTGHTGGSCTHAYAPSENEMSGNRMAASHCMPLPVQMDSEQLAENAGIWMSMGNRERIVQ